MLQVSEKIASYHIIVEPVTAEQLFNSGGVVTEGGAVPAERSVSGGFFGVGGKGIVVFLVFDSISLLVTSNFHIVLSRGWRGDVERGKGCEILGVCRCYQDWNHTRSRWIYFAKHSVEIRRSA
jgi:hypothetical protein